MQAVYGTTEATTVGGIHIGDCNESTDAYCRNAFVSTKTYMPTCCVIRWRVGTTRKVGRIRGTVVGQRVWEKLPLGSRSRAPGGALGAKHP